MNERIRELLKQATKEVWGNNEFNGSPEFEGYEVDQEKFAELIVRECCDKINNHIQINNPNDCLLVLDIKEHFGVE